MDYKKAYKEALERARKLEENSNGMILKKWLWNVFPELKEPEDEKTWLIKAIEEEIYNLSIDIRDEEDRIKLKNLKRSLAWLEKQGEQNPTDNKEKLDVLNFIRKETCCGLAEANNALLKLIKVLKEHPFPIMDKSYKLKIEWEEQQGEQNLANNVKPKFNGGDWIVWKDKCYKVNYNGCGYELVGQNGLSTSLEYGTIDENAHLWTIQSAKDGDVLFHSDSASNGIFIFKEILQCGNIQKVQCYCDYDSEDGFCLGEKHACCWTNSKILHPATKEQRDRLFQKMKEKGYEWDAEKKELKKGGNNDTRRIEKK